MDDLQELQELRRRVALLEDRDRILAALYRYAHAVEHGTDEDFLNCFTDDAVFDIHYSMSPDPPPVHHGTRHERGVLHRGREQLAAYIAGNAARRAGVPQFRMLADPTIDLDGDTATATSYLVGVMPVEGPPEIIDLGRYRDRLRRVGPAEWRIEHRVVEVLAWRPHTL